MPPFCGNPHGGWQFMRAKECVGDKRVLPTLARRHRPSGHTQLTAVFAQAVFAGENRRQRVVDGLKS
jgi:hypothetical protein